MIEAHGLVKRYGSAVAVSDLSFSIRPGLSELIPVRASLEEAFMELTRESVEYQAAGAPR